VELREMRSDMKRMLDCMEARDRKEEQAETDRAARAQASTGYPHQRPNQYPPPETNEYQRLYHPHPPSPGYHYPNPNTYQGYPLGIAMHPHNSPHSGHQQNGYQGIAPQMETNTRPKARDLNKHLFDGMTTE
jgi:hypothetical protein